METLKTILVGAVKAVLRRQQLLTTNLTGNAFLLFVAYVLKIDGASGTTVLDAVLVLLPASFLLCWLQASTLAAFYPGQSEVPYFPVLRRLHYYLPWVAALVGVLVLFRWMSSVLSPLVWVLGIAVALALLPLAAQAAGGWFDRSVALDVVFDGKYWILAAGVLAGGVYLPITVLASLSTSEDIFAQMFITGLRIGFSYLLGVSAWVVLAAIIGELAARVAAPETHQGEDIARLSESLSAQPQTVTPNRPFSKNAIAMEKSRNHTSQ